MNKITIKDYDNAISFVMDFVEELPKEIVPDIIIHNGQIKNPGVSDIDMVFGFKDNFVLSNYFLHLFQKKIKNLKNNEVFFHHLPHIYPLSSLSLLPSMTYNPSEELNILKGSIVFNSKKMNEYQNILNSFEQIHSRITMLIKLKISEQKMIHALMLIGHSLSHSINCLNDLGAKLELDNFKFLKQIEDRRSQITSHQELRPIDFDDVCMGLINEFYVLLKWINKKIESKVLVHFSSEKEIYQYDDNIFLIKLNQKIEKFIYHLNNSKVFIEGFEWPTLCIYENYFVEPDSYETIFSDILLSDEIKKRVKFIKNLVSFNFNNFNSALGRSAFHPLVQKNMFNWSARNLLLSK